MSRRDLHVREALRMLRFGIVGVANTAIYTGTYAGLLAIGVPYLGASVLAYLVAISIAYFLNHRFTFRVADHSSSLVVRFFAVQAGAAVANIALLALLVEGVGMGPLVAQFVTLPPVVLSTFALNRLVVFHQHVDSRLS
jgi:putative flippase GtrA